MRATRVLGLAGLTVLLACCHSSPATRGTEGAAPVSPSTEPRRVELVQDKAVEVADGVKVTLKSVLYTHGTDKAGRSVNDSLMQLEVTSQGKTENLTLQRLFPDEAKYQSVAGVRLAIDYVDAYHQPSTGAVLVLPEAAK